jgi:hypothetical protein
MFSQELLRRHKERILMENASDDDHRMRPHDVNHRVSSKFREMVCADDRIVMATPHVINSRFEFDELVDVGWIFNRPVHAADNAAERKPSLGVAAGQLLERLQHSILIEASIAKVGFGVGSKLELSILLGCRRVDPYRGQPLQMVVMLTRINNVNRLVPTLKPVPDEGKQNPVLFVFTVEERADMTRFAELGAGKGDGRSDPLHIVVSYME